MSQDVFIWTFIILSLAHPIADFWFGGNRRLHYFVSLNILHFLYDKSPFRFHHKYMKEVIESDHICAFDDLESKIPDGAFNYYSHVLIPVIPQKRFPMTHLLIEHKFWRALSIDQFAHVLLNVVFALFLEWVF